MQLYELNKPNKPNWTKEVIEMLSREYVLEKIKSLPDEALEEVVDFIDFLEMKSKKEVEVTELDMKDYLPQLTAYEELLVRGKIEWK